MRHSFHYRARGGSLVKKAIRWGIWGTGHIAHKVASDFCLASGGVLHAAASRTEEQARRFATQHGAAKWYGGLNSLLNDAEVDAVYVATPNQRHAEDSIACMEAGKAVLCEKPFALNLRQAQRMVDAARLQKVFCMEAMWTRFIPAVVEAKRRIDAGDIGPIRMIQGNFGHPMPDRPGSRVFDIELGGGALLDLGVYPISLAQHLLGAAHSIKGTGTLAATGVDEQSSYQLLFANGALAHLWASLRVRGTDEAVIFGERGSLRLCEPFYRADRFVLRSHGLQQAATHEGPSPDATGIKRAVAALRTAPAAQSLRRRLSPLLALLRRGHMHAYPFAGNGYQFEVMEVNRCLLEQRTESAIMPLDDSLEVMRIMDALRAQWGLVYPQEKATGG